MRGKPVFAIYKGERTSVAMIAKATGLSRQAILDRIKAGKPLDAPRQTSKGQHRLRLEYDGKTMTVDEIAAATGLSRSTIYSRHDGVTFYPPTRKPALVLTFNGITDTSRGWAERLGVSQGAILQRLNRGWTVQHTIATDRLREHRTYTFKGETLTIGQWSKRTGIAKVTLYERLHHLGWTVEAALTLPVATNSERRQRRIVLMRLIEGFRRQSATGVALPRREGPPALQTFADAPSTGPGIKKSHLFGKSERSAL